MNVRTKVETAGVMLMSLASALSFQGLASPVMASSRPVHATGSFELDFDLETIELVEQGQQCLFHVEETITYTGTLKGTSTTVGPVQVRLFATCEEAVAANGAPIPSNFSAVEHFVGIDHREATFRTVGRTDAAGNFEGTIALHGDLNGRLDVVASGTTGTYDGFVVVTD